MRIAKRSAPTKTPLTKLLVYNLSFLVIAGIFGSIIGEVYLRLDGRYADLVNENLTPSRGIYDRVAGETQYQRHPDLDYDVEIVVNDFGARDHRGVTLEQIEEFEGDIIGVFGDSFTENRRIEDEFTFTSLLNEGLQPEVMVLNLGVDGYGPDQSYVKYLDFEGRSTLDHVFYVFFENDLRNIYENQLFDFDGAKISEPLPHETSLFIKVARKFHMTYLVIDSYARLKANMQSEAYSLAILNEKISNRLRPDEFRARDERYHDEYADSMTTDYLSANPSASTIEWGVRFRRLLEAWREESSTLGQSFVILVTPDQPSTNLARKLFGTEFAAETIFLNDYFPEGYQNFRFADDGHWNEKGNLRAAEGIADWGASAEIWPFDKRRWAAIKESTERAIGELYQP
jgi:hypothetical protein